MLLVNLLTITKTNVKNYILGERGKDLYLTIETQLQSVVEESLVLGIDLANKNNTEFTELNVWLGKKETVKAYVKSDIYKIIPKARKRYLKAVVVYNGPIEAPIKKDDIVGKLKISYKDEIIEEHDLLAYENIKKVNIFSRLIKSFNYLIWGDV